MYLLPKLCKKMKNPRKFYFHPLMVHQIKLNNTILFYNFFIKKLPEKFMKIEHCIVIISCGGQIRLGKMIILTKN